MWSLILTLSVEERTHLDCHRSLAIYVVTDFLFSQRVE